MRIELGHDVSGAQARSLASESLRQCSATSSQTRIRARICCCSQQHPSEPQALALSRRAVVSGAVAGAASTTLDRHAQAASFPSLFDKAWEAVGGGPADLYFPDAFSGRWIVTAMLNKVEMPLGAKFVPDVATVSRAVKEDLETPVEYEVSFIRNHKGRVITDRRFNTASLMALYLGKDAIDARKMTWNPDDPNTLVMNLPGGTDVRTRVTRRSQDDDLASERLNTSEFFEQIFDLPDRPQPKVKASQCFTKYKWRSAEEAATDGGPEIVATQVVSDYLTPYDGEMLMMQAKDRPVVVYTYRMTFRRPNVNF